MFPTLEDWSKEAETSQGLQKTLTLLREKTKASSLADAEQALLAATTLDLSNAPWGKKTDPLDCRPLAKFGNLKLLKADYWSVENADTLALLSGLEVLSLRCTQLKDITFLKGLTCLREVYFDENHIEDLSALAELTELKVANFKHNQVRKLVGVEKLLKLIELNLNENQLTDLKPLSSLVEMQKLSLGTNLIDDLSPLSKMKKLKVLDVSNNRLQDINALEYLSNIQELDMRKNRVMKIGPLKNMSFLAKLGVSGNPIYDDDLQILKRSVMLT